MKEHCYRVRISAPVQKWYIFEGYVNVPAIYNDAKYYITRGYGFDWELVETDETINVSKFNSPTDEDLNSLLKWVAFDCEVLYDTNADELEEK